jgi:hypothetical protein
MDIKDFNLAWRWTQSSYGRLPEDLLGKLKPLSIEEAKLIAVAIPLNVPPGASKVHFVGWNSNSYPAVTQLPISEQRITYRGMVRLLFLCHGRCFASFGMTFVIHQAMMQIPFLKMANIFCAEAVEFIQNEKWRMKFMFREPIKVIL